LSTTDATGSPSRIRSIIESPTTLASLLGFSAFLRMVYLFGLGPHIRMSGDETFYFKSANALLVALGVGEAADGAPSLYTAIVSRGWFLPGMSTILVPIRAFDSVFVARSYLALITFGLLVWAAMRIRRDLGSLSALGFVLIVGFNPAFVTFSITMWGEVIGSMLVVLILLWLKRIMDRVLHGGNVRWYALVGLGAALGGVTYVRPSYLPISLVVAAGIALSFLHRLGARRALRPALISVGLVAVTAAFVILPWSLMVSTAKGGFFLTTTSVGMSQIVAFGLAEDLDPVIDGGNSFIDWYNHVDDLAKEQGVPFADALSQERSRVLDKVTWSSYQDSVGRNLQNFFASENEFPRRFVDLASADGVVISDTAVQVGFTVNTLIWRAVLIFGLVLLAVPLSPRSESWALSLLYKAAVVMLVIQPFVSAASGRYYVGVIPVFGLGFAFIAAPGALHNARLALSRCQDLTLAEYGVAGFQAGVTVATVAAFLLFWL